MNEFAAKKLGEVLAFALVGDETLEKGRSVLSPVLGENELTDILDKNRIHADELKKLAGELGVSEIVNAKFEKTGAKLREMRELYIGGEWENPTEILEWSGFFEGAAFVHWGLVKGVAETLNHELLMTLAEECMNFHHDLLDTISSELQSVGQAKAQ